MQAETASAYHTKKALTGMEKGQELTSTEKGQELTSMEKGI
jgi:hypothetical protein